MPVFDINGISVDFPFEPYNVQREYISKVIECLDRKVNGMLESPTGTGKTLCLLCGALSWLQRYRMQKTCKKEILPPQPSSPSIIYATRTHSQIQQAMQELKRSAYGTMKATALGSRDQLCIHIDVLKEKDIVTRNLECASLIAKRKCTYYSKNLKNMINRWDNQLSSVMDIEDLMKLGKEYETCPYYTSKELADDADILFMPYNYLFDPRIRKANKISLDNKILLIDEAHNIDKVCEAAASTAISCEDIEMYLESFKVIDPKYLNPETRIYFHKIVQVMKKLHKTFYKFAETGQLKDDDLLFDGSYIFEILKETNITIGNVNETLVIINTIIEEFTTKSDSSSTASERKFVAHIYRNAMRSLRMFYDFLVTIFNDESDNLLEEANNSFKVNIRISKTNVNEKLKENVTINYWCFNPGYAMAGVTRKQTHSIILTSGTLAPFEPLIAELSLPTSVFLVNTHIVEKCQVYVDVISCGPDQEELRSNYANREKTAYMDSLGETIHQLCPVIPDGLLIFFPSYSIMNSYRIYWKRTGIWDKINKIKNIFVEPRSMSDLASVMNNYYKKVNELNSRGACFMAVCRGKVSEGLDFADKNGRAVIVTGLPYPPVREKKVEQKQEYLEKNRLVRNDLPDAKTWYSLQATRAVNQAVGRVIRHKNDYGAILLCDSRFGWPTQMAELSAWIRSYLPENLQRKNFQYYKNTLKEFFDTASEQIADLTSEEFPVIYTQEMLANMSDTSLLDETDDLYENNSDDEILGNMDLSTCSAISKCNSEGSEQLKTPIKSSPSSPSTKRNPSVDCQANIDGKRSKLIFSSGLSDHDKLKFENDDDLFDDEFLERIDLLTSTPKKE